MLCRTRQHKERIAFIIQHYTLESASTILNSAQILAECGFKVDILTDQEVDRGALGEMRDVSVIPLSNRSRSGISCSWQSRLRALREIMGFSGKLLAAASEHHYGLLIGASQYGLMSSTLVGKLRKIPVAYLNLELTTLSANPNSLSHWFEAWCNQQAEFTVVQDEDRADVLIRENGISRDKTILVPVGARGPAYTKSSDYLRDRFDLAYDTRILLHAGTISNREFRCFDFARVATRVLPDDWVLIVHGWASNTDELNELRGVGDNVIVSTDVVPYDELDHLIGSADVGVALYKDINTNYSLMGSASQKLAHYLKCGLPVIVSELPSLCSVISLYRCGVCVSDSLTSREIATAIEEITSGYDDYTEGAIRCFNDRYNFDRRFRPVVDRIASLLQVEVNCPI